MKKVIFIVGAPRSGTTWLQIMLAKHPDIATCQERHLFSSYLAPMRKAWINHRNNNRGIGLQAAISYDQFVQYQRLFASSVISSKSTKSIFVEKTPAHVRHIEHIIEVFPNAHFIHIVRDPRAVVNSLQAANRSWGTSWAGKGVVENAELWLNDVNFASISAKQHQEIFYEVSYEQLLEKTDFELYNLFKWIDVIAENEMCKKIADDAKIDNLKNRNTSLPWSATKEPEGFFRSGKQDTWRKELSSDKIAIIENICRYKMIEYDYQISPHKTIYLKKYLSRMRRGIGWRVKRLGEQLYG